MRPILPDRLDLHGNKSINILNQARTRGQTAVLVLDIGFGPVYGGWVAVSGLSMLWCMGTCSSGASSGGRRRRLGSGVADRLGHASILKSLEDFLSCLAQQLVLVCKGTWLSWEKMQAVMPSRQSKDLHRCQNSCTLQKAVPAFSHTVLYIPKSLP